MKAVKLTRRELLKGAAIASAASLLAACQPKVVEVTKVVEKVVKETIMVEGTPQIIEKVVKETVVVEKEAPKPAREPATVVWWFGWNAPAQMDAFTTIAKNFSDLDNGITVEALQVPTMNDKMLAAVAGGNPPDVGVCCINYTGYYARGVFTPIDDYVAASNNIKKEDFVPGLFESMTWRGKLYGVPTCECGPRYGLMMNRNHIEEAGLDPENLPETWDDAWEWHTKLTQKDDAGNLSRLFLDPHSGTGRNGPAPNIAWYWNCAWGFEPWNGETMTFDFDNENMVEILTTLKRFYDDIGMEKLDAFSQANPGGNYVPTGAFPAGLLSGQIIGYYGPGELKAHSPDLPLVVGWGPRPEKRRNVTFQCVGGHPAYIPLASQVRDQAYEFVEYLASDDAIDIIFKATGWLGGRIKNYDPNRADVAEIQGLKWFLESSIEADEMWSGPVNPIQGFVITQKDRAVSAVQYGELTPEQAAAELQVACTEELAKEFPELLPQ